MIRAKIDEAMGYSSLHYHIVSVEQYILIDSEAYLPQALEHGK